MDDNSILQSSIGQVSGRSLAHPVSSGIGTGITVSGSKTYKLTGILPPGPFIVIRKDMITLDNDLVTKRRECIKKRNILHDAARDNMRAISNLSDRNKNFGFHKRLIGEFHKIFDRYCQHYERVAGHPAEVIPVKLAIYSGYDVNLFPASYIGGQPIRDVAKPLDIKIVNIPRHVCYSLDIFVYIRKMGYRVIDDELNNVFLGDEMISIDTSLPGT